MTKILTISVAAYQIEKYINTTLMSVLDDRIIDDVEVLVIDDGGTDASLEIALEYQKKYPNTVKAIHKENGGYGSVLNTAFDLAVGKYFKQLDGDDTLIKDNLVEIVALLKTLDVDYISTPSVAVYEGNTEKRTILNPYIKYDEGLYEMDDIMPDRVLTMHGAIIRTDILKKMEGRITEHCFYSDVEMILLALPFLNKAYVSKTPLYEYHIGVQGQSMSIEGIRKHYKDHERVFEKILGLKKQYTNLGRGRQSVLETRIIKEIWSSYNFLLVQPYSKKIKEDIRKFDSMMRAECPELRDKAIKGSKRLSLLINTDFALYPIIRLLTIWTI